MAEEDVPKTDAVAKSLANMNIADKDFTSGKDEILSGTSFSAASSRDVSSRIKGKNDNKSVGENSVSYPPTSSYNNYYYRGYSGNTKHVDGYYQADGSYTGMQSHSGNTQQPYGANGNASSRTFNTRPHTHPIGPLNKVPRSVPNFSSGFSRGYRPSYHYMKQYYPENDSSNHVQNVQTGSRNDKFDRMDKTWSGNDKFDQRDKTWTGNDKFDQRYKTWTGNDKFDQRDRTWTGNDRFNQRGSCIQNADSSEIARGPRTNHGICPSNSPIEESFELTTCRDQYNLPDFEIHYENAKFYVIKSFSEDNVHKCVKYDVWSSTATGNRKLDAAFHEAEAKANEAGTKCPVFLFFSVNKSGQFVGCAEMVGKVDFNKDMDFWKLDIWNGFFPVKWHIVKDIPNALLRHIILENTDDNRDVTFTKDAQEIGLKQGLEMLKIFKNHCAKTSLLDDFNFYEMRDKSGCTKTSKKCQLKENH